ncbi:hypothetical protein PYCC9005_004548 [Savitreella phatthalungensis]
MPAEYDIAVVGATGFTGKLVARYLVKSGPRNLKWCVVGRSQAKLNDVVDELKSIAGNDTAVASKPGLLVADTSKDADCDKIANHARVVLTTVGPYALYGEQLIRACARNGTHYCDLTGELPWYRKMLLAYGEDAKKSGAVLVPCSGFDSVPVDIANWLVAKTVRERFDGAGTTDARTVIEKVQGGVSGGTLASAIGLMETFSLTEVQAAHSPNGIIDAQTRGSPATPRVKWEPELKRWTSSWLGDNVDGNVSRRSAHLLGGYGSRWATRGSLAVTSWWRAAMMWYLTVTGGIMLAIPPVRWALKKLVTQPGFGPSEEQLDNGFLKLRGYGASDRNPSRDKVSVTIHGKGDPGYKMTARFIAAVAITLAYDLEKTVAGKLGGGFATPATLGEQLVKRLEDAEVHVEVD